MDGGGYAKMFVLFSGTRGAGSDIGGEGVTFLADSTRAQIFLYRKYGCAIDIFREFINYLHPERFFPYLHKRGGL